MFYKCNCIHYNAQLVYLNLFSAAINNITDRKESTETRASKGPSFVAETFAFQFVS